MFLTHFISAPPTICEYICRVCRCEGTPDKPLYHPCVCTGSIKFIHQDCLVQWLKYSKKEYCELCKYRFAFTPIYSPDMPKRLPIKDIISGLLTSIGRAVRYWFHYTLVAFAWLGVVPLTACRIYRCLFTGSVSSLLTLPLDMLSTENIVSDCFQGCFVVTCTLCAFISLVWLREQILHGGGPDWLEHEDEANNQGRNFFDGGVMMNNLMGMAPLGRGAAGNANAEGNGGAAAAAGEGGNLNEEGVAGAPEVEVFDVAAMGANNGAQDDNNWNPIEWDRAAEELTWERLLGLDGSLVFLEHVFWVVSLNTLFILVFAFCPYHIGHFTLVGLKIDDLVTTVVPQDKEKQKLKVVASHFEGLLTALTGYIVFALALVSIYLLFVLVIFGSTVLLMLWLPVRVIRRLMPTFLPYNAVLNNDAVMSELSLELLLLQVVLPALLEQGHIRAWLKSVVRGWTIGMAWVLDLRSYLIGDIPLSDQDNIIQGDQPPVVPVPNAAPAAAAPPAAAPAPAPQAQAGLGAAHQAMLQGGGPTGFQAYKRPSFFTIRVFLLVVFMCVTLFTASLVSLVVPVFIGRKLMGLWMGEAKIHELYTAACGLYICWLLLRIGTVLYNWIPQGTAVIMKKLKEWAILALESLTIATFLLGVIPLLLGMLFELVIVVPLRVPVDQTPLYFPWQVYNPHGKSGSLSLSLSGFSLLCHSFFFSLPHSFLNPLSFLPFLSFFFTFPTSPLSFPHLSSFFSPPLLFLFPTSPLSFPHLSSFFSPPLLFLFPTSPLSFPHTFFCI
ncbi:MARCH6 [Acanthosepion pharaonis]|uniref:E3 ubiquitin-protein ligase MARCHF6 n=1 Tax=Acanthosepion pharaonis TaxID=158019 RepID=A0A812AYT4_ACAPH|nr:MARCH6 [Sepia pharaonis]